MNNITIPDIKAELKAMQINFHQLRFARPISDRFSFKILKKSVKYKDLSDITYKLLTRFPQLNQGQLAHLVSIAINI
jgi:hypothetical protein